MMKEARLPSLFTIGVAKKQKRPVARYRIDRLMKPRFPKPFSCNIWPARFYDVLNEDQSSKKPMFITISLPRFACILRIK